MPAQAGLGRALCSAVSRLIVFSIFPVAQATNKDSENQILPESFTPLAALWYPMELDVSLYAVKYHFFDYCAKASPLETMREGHVSPSDRTHAYNSFLSGHVFWLTGGRF